MRFWWVNQGQTYEAERAGQYLWSPQRTRAGHRRAAYDRMPQIVQGDRIVHYAGGQLRSHSVAVTGGYEAQQPIELAREDLWDDHGWRVDVHHRPIARSVPRAEAHLIGPEEDPFTVTGTVKQDYLFEVTSDFCLELIARLAGAGPDASESGRRTATAGDPADQTGTTVPLEAGHALQFKTATTAEEREAIRDEWLIVDQLVAATGLAPNRRRYRLDDGTTLFSDLWVEGVPALVEAKSRATRRAVREGIGQLIDYAHKEGGRVERVLLLPERPPEDLVDVLRNEGILGVWPTNDGWGRSDNGPLLGPPLVTLGS